MDAITYTPEETLIICSAILFIGACMAGLLKAAEEIATRLTRSRWSYRRMKKYFED